MLADQLICFQRATLPWEALEVGFSAVSALYWTLWLSAAQLIAFSDGLPNGFAESDATQHVALHAVRPKPSVWNLTVLFAQLQALQLLYDWYVSAWLIPTGQRASRRRNYLRHTFRCT